MAWFKTHGHENGRPEAGDSTGVGGIAQTVTVIDAPRPKSGKLQPKPVEARAKPYLEEYAEIAGQLGIAVPDQLIEEFKAFLVEQDIPVFALAEVVKYMDAKAAKESKDRCGWEWRPLRDQDALPDVRFGTEARRDYVGTTEERPDGIQITPGSDYWRGPRRIARMPAGMPAGMMATTAPISELRNYQAAMLQAQAQQALQPQTYVEPGSSKTYDKTVPLHALRKALLIDKKFAGKVSLFVCDYALAPQVQYPDPFLMAVIPNPKLDIGIGRFVIDFWDEPGFGLEQMLK